MQIEHIQWGGSVLAVSVISTFVVWELHQFFFFCFLYSAIAFIIYLLKPPAKLRRIQKFADNNHLEYKITGKTHRLIANISDETVTFSLKKDTFSIYYSVEIPLKGDFYIAPRQKRAYITISVTDGYFSQTGYPGFDTQFAYSYKDLAFVYPFFSKPIRKRIKQLMNIFNTGVVISRSGKKTKMSAPFTTPLSSISITTLEKMFDAGKAFFMALKQMEGLTDPGLLIENIKKDSNPVFRRKNLVLLFARHMGHFDLEEIKSITAPHHDSALTGLLDMMDLNREVNLDTLDPRIFKDFVEIQKSLVEQEYVPRLQGVYNSIDDDELKTEIMEIIANFDEHPEFHGRLSVSSGDETGNVSLV